METASRSSMKNKEIIYLGFLELHAEGQQGVAILAIISYDSPPFVGLKT